MTKKLIDIDDDLLTEARDILGTKTWKETVATALADVVARKRRGDFVDLLASGRLQLKDPEVMAKAWRQ